METLVQERLKDLRVERGLTLEQLAEEIGLSKSALGGYETDELKEIGHNTIRRLAKFYGVTTDYLLCLSEAKQPSDASIQGLSISDDMVEVLRGNTLNNGLLCELVTNPQFPKLLADIEIYADGIVTSQVQNMNVCMDAVREEVISKYQPEGYDPYLNILEASHLEEGEFFRYRVNETMGAILRDLYAAHKDNRISGPQISILEKMKQNIDKLKNFKGTLQERQVFMLCNQIEVDYYSLTKAQKSTMGEIAKKSKLLRSGVSQKGKK